MYKKLGKSEEEGIVREGRGWRSSREEVGMEMEEGICVKSVQVAVQICVRPG